MKRMIQLEKREVKVRYSGLFEGSNLKDDDFIVASVRKSNKNMCHNH